MDKTLILKQIKEHYNFKSDAEFARFLEITPQNLKHWFTRNTFDASILAMKCSDICSNWLLTGEGNMLETTATPDESIDCGECECPMQVMSASIAKIADSVAMIAKGNIELIQQHVKLVELLYKSFDKK